MALAPGAPLVILAPVSLGDGETYAKLFTRLRNSGYTRVRIDGEIQPVTQATTLDARRKHRVEVVIDRTIVRPRARGRIAESVEHALALGNGVMTLLEEAVETVPPEGDEHDPPSATSAGPAEPPTRHTPQRESMFSQKLACPACGTSFEELSPHHFSFNSQLGWCEVCEGLGVQRGAPAAAIIHQPGRALLDGAVAGWGRIDPQSPFGRMLTALCCHLGVGPETPLREWTAEQKRVLMFGSPAGDWIDGGAAFRGLRFQWRGFFPTIDAATRNSWLLRHQLHNVVTDIPCLACHGGRIRPDAAAVRLGGDDRPPAEGGRPAAPGGRTIVEVCELPLCDVASFFDELRLDERRRRIAGEVLKEIRARLQFLLDVGLDYLTLHRAAPTLAGGEAQRIRLASQIGSGLSGVLYVLDEPTIGLHPRDNLRLIKALQKLRNLGNTVLMVEHDRDVIRHADGLLDFGPRAGADGGEIVASGPPSSFCQPPGRAPGNGKKRTPPEAAPAAEPSARRSLTQAYLSGIIAVPVPLNRRPVEFAEELLVGDERRKRPPVAAANKQTENVVL
jgi:excinuclease ABC subunit A